MQHEILSLTSLSVVKVARSLFAYVVLTVEAKGSRRREFIAYWEENREDDNVSLKYWSFDRPLSTLALSYGKSCYHEVLHDILQWGKKCHCRAQEEILPLIAKYLYNLSSQGNTKHNMTDFQKLVGDILCEVRSFAVKVRREEGREGKSWKDLESLGRHKLYQKV